MVVSALCLSGCAAKIWGPYTSEERGILSNVSLNPVEIESDAYEKPDVIDDFNMPSMGQIGILPYLIISNLSLHPEERKFINENLEYYERLAPSIRNFSKRLDGRFLQAFKSNDFFRGRLTNSSDNKFSFVVTAFGFVRDSQVKQDVGLKFYLDVNVNLKSKSRKINSHGLIFGKSKSPHTIKEFVEDSSLMNKAVDEAIEEVSSSLEGMLKVKTMEIDWE